MAKRVTWRDDFVYSGGTFGTAASATTPWRITDTSSAGTPIYVAGVDNGTSAGIGHYARLSLEATNEIQNVCLSFGDVLQHSITENLIARFRIKLGQAALDTATSLFFGVAGDRNDTITSIAQRAGFTMVGGTSTTVVFVVTDDGTTDSGNISTVGTLTTGWKEFEIHFGGLTDVKFFMTNANSQLVRVSPTTTFNMSAYAGCVQPIFQIQKTADTNVDEMHIDSVELSWTPGASA